MSSEVLLQKIDALTQGVVHRDAQLKTLRLTIEKLKMELSYLKAHALRARQREARS